MPDPNQRNNIKALTHGLRSERNVIPGLESQEEWERHRDGIVASLHPVGLLEESLALEVASTSWRLRRVLRYENEAISVCIRRTDGDPALCFLQPEVTDRVMRAEATLHNRNIAALRQLSALQERRRARESDDLVTQLEQALERAKE